MDEQRTKRYSHYESQIEKNKFNNTRLKELSFAEKMKIKENVDNNNQLECVIKDVEKKNKEIVLKVSPVCCKSFEKEVSLGCGFYLNKDSEYEEFLKNNGISPIQDDIEEDLVQSKVSLYLSVDDKSVSLNHKKPDNKQNNKNNEKDDEYTPGIYRDVDNDSPFQVDKSKIEPDETEFKNVVGGGVVLGIFCVIGYSLFILIKSTPVLLPIIASFLILMLLEG